MQTLPSNLVGVYRITLGLVVIISGFLLLPGLPPSIKIRSYLALLGIYHEEYVHYVIFLYELVVGCLLVIGYFSRIGAILVLPIILMSFTIQFMTINLEDLIFGIYHAFYPSLISMLTIVVLINGGGSWSIDLKLQDEKK